MSEKGKISAEARAKLQRLREEYSDFLSIAQTLPGPIGAIARFIEVAIEDENTKVEAHLNGGTRMKANASNNYTLSEEEISVGVYPMDHLTIYGSLHSSKFRLRMIETFKQLR